MPEDRVISEIWSSEPFINKQTISPHYYSMYSLHIEANLVSSKKQSYFEREQIVTNSRK